MIQPQDQSFIIIPKILFYNWLNLYFSPENILLRSYIFHYFLPSIKYQMTKYHVRFLTNRVSNLTKLMIQMSKITYSFEKIWVKRNELSSQSDVYCGIPHVALHGKKYLCSTLNMYLGGCTCIIHGIFISMHALYFFLLSLFFVHCPFFS